MAFLKCGLCEETAATFKVLPCLHLMCEKCVVLYFEKHAQITNIIPCPTCGQKLKMPKTGGIQFKSFSNKNHVDFLDDNSTKISDNPTSSQTHSLPVENGSGDGRFYKSTDKDLNNEDLQSAINIKTSANDQSIPSTNKDQLGDLEEVFNSKKDYVKELLKDMERCMTQKNQQTERLETLIKQLMTTKEETETQLESRADHLCKIIHEKKVKLQNEINNICNVQLEKYRNKQENSQKDADLFNDAYLFSETVLKSNDSAGLLDLHNEITGRLLDLIHSYQDSLDIFTIKLDSPDRGKEELHLSKLFGQYLSGSIKCGMAELVSSFNIELSWPSSLITTKLNDFVVVGKTGAFETCGRVMFCDSNGHLKGNHIYPDDTVPFDALLLQDGSILVSDNHGSVTKFSMFGNVLDVWKQKFKGSGRMARNFENDILITSSEEQCIYKYSSNGKFIRRFPEEKCKAVFEHPHAITVDGRNNIIVADYQQNCVFWLDFNGKLLHKYTGNDSVKLRCPSAVTCDPFDNVLVADFTNDTVHLVSNSGEFLGHLLTKDNELSCPNFLTLDPDGLLFVGQYGGQIQVFRYLSCSRQA